jgi:hypothetical protein
MKTTKTGSSGRNKRLLDNSQYHSRRYPISSTRVPCQLCELGVVFASKDNLFTTILNAIVSTIVGAWSRCYLNQEKAYATL